MFDPWVGKIPWRGKWQSVLVNSPFNTQLILDSQPLSLGFRSSEILFVVKIMKKIEKSFLIAVQLILVKCVIYFLMANKFIQL